MADSSLNTNTVAVLTFVPVAIWDVNALSITNDISDVDVDADIVELNSLKIPSVIGDRDVVVEMFDVSSLNTSNGIAVVDVFVSIVDTNSRSIDKSITDVNDNTGIVDVSSLNTFSSGEDVDVTVDIVVVSSNNEKMSISDNRVVVSIDAVSSRSTSNEHVVLVCVLIAATSSRIIDSSIADVDDTLGMVDTSSLNIVMYGDDVDVTVAIVVASSIIENVSTQ